MCIRLLASLGYCNVDFKTALKWQNCEYNDAFLGENKRLVWLFGVLFFPVLFFYYTSPPLSFCTGWVFCSLLLSLAGLIPGHPSDCSTAPQTEWVCTSHSSPSLCSSRSFPFARTVHLVVSSFSGRFTGIHKSLWLTKLLPSPSI